MESNNTNMTPVTAAEYAIIPITPSYEENTTLENGFFNFTAESNSSVMKGTQGFLYGAIFVFGLLLNFSVIWLIHRKRSLHSVTNMWVTSLCISQSLICVISLPFIIISVIVDDWPFGFAFCRIFGFYTTILRTVSILSAAGIALDRYHVITRPFTSRMRKSSARILICLIWWSAVVASLPPIFGIGLYRYSSTSHLCSLGLQLGGSALVFQSFYFSSIYITSLLVTAVSYVLIYKVTRNQAIKRKRPSNAGGLASVVSPSRLGRTGPLDVSNFTAINKEVPLPRRRLAKIYRNNPGRTRISFRQRMSVSLSNGLSPSSIDSRAALSIFLVLVTFLCTWIPYFVFAFYASANLPDSKLSSNNAWFEFFTLWLSFSNVVWDPILYGALNHNFRSHFKDWVRSGRIFKFLRRIKRRRKSSRYRNDQNVDECVSLPSTTSKDDSRESAEPCQMAVSIENSAVSRDVNEQSCPEEQMVQQHIKQDIQENSASSTIANHEALRMGYWRRDLSSSKLHTSLQKSMIFFIPDRSQDARKQTQSWVAPSTVKIPRQLSNSLRSMKSLRRNGAYKNKDFESPLSQSIKDKSRLKHASSNGTPEKLSSPTNDNPISDKSLPMTLDEIDKYYVKRTYYNRPLRHEMNCKMERKHRTSGDISKCRGSRTATSSFQSNSSNNGGASFPETTKSRRCSSWTFLDDEPNSRDATYSHKSAKDTRFRDISKQNRKRSSNNNHRKINRTRLTLSATNL